jgi:hypothetical protein
MTRWNERQRLRLRVPVTPRIAAAHTLPFSGAPARIGCDASAITRPNTALGIIALPHSQERHARQHYEPARALEKSIEPGRTHPIPPAFSPTEFLRRLRSAETLISLAETESAYCQ